VTCQARVTGSRYRRHHLDCQEERHCDGRLSGLDLTSRIALPYAPRSKECDIVVDACALRVAIRRFGGRSRNRFFVSVGRLGDFVHDVLRLRSLHSRLREVVRTFITAAPRHHRQLKSPILRAVRLTVSTGCLPTVGPLRGCDARKTFTAQGRVTLCYYARYSLHMASTKVRLRIYFL
jgi:hypothetical protein